MGVFVYAALLILNYTYLPPNLGLYICAALADESLINYGELLMGAAAEQLVM